MTAGAKRVAHPLPGVYQNGHYGAALLAYAPVCAVLTAIGRPTLALVGGTVAVGLATVPDLDVRVPGIPHRGPTHTVWFALLVGLVAGALGYTLGGDAVGFGPVALGGLGFLVGVATICSHILADALTPMGVTPLTPFSDRHYSLGWVRADNTIANWLLLAVGVVAVAGAFAGAQTVV